MVELHVDDFKQMDDANGLVRNLNLHFPSHVKPLIIIGYYECIFKKYYLSKKHRVSPCGTWVLVSKDQGQVTIVSVFQSREFGFGFVMSPEQLQQVNNMRIGKKYKGDKAAFNRLRTSFKKDLLKSRFIKEFEYGATNEGFWCYDHMVLHFEGVAGCLITLYPQYNYLFLFVHSCGHDKQREDGLNVQK
jgi:hypothetical protein